MVRGVDRKGDNDMTGVGGNIRGSVDTALGIPRRKLWNPLLGVREVKGSLFIPSGTIFILIYNWFRMGSLGDDKHWLAVGFLWKLESHLSGTSQRGRGISEEWVPRSFYQPNVKYLLFCDLIFSLLPYISGVELGICMVSGTPTDSDFR